MKLALLLLLAACDGPPARSDHCPAPTLWEPDDYDGALLACRAVPELCDLPVESEIREPDLDVAIDVVFVGDGYTAATIERYRQRVNTLVAQLDADAEGVLGRDPTLFNIHRIDLVSPEAADVISTLRPLQSCSHFDESRFLQVDLMRAVRAGANAPAADVIVVLVPGIDEARANAPSDGQGRSLVLLGHDDSAATLTHELGHALIGLGDEYVDLYRQDPEATMWEAFTDDPLLEPNLSLLANEDWDGAWSGVREGGRRYSQGVYRPTDHCRMGDEEHHGTFCPVCAVATDAVLAARRGEDDGPPVCVLALYRGDAGGMRTVRLGARDASGLVGLRIAIDTLDLDLSPFLPVGPPLQYRSDLVIPGSEQVVLTCTDALGNASTATLVIP
jgi:hypothetical protein